MTRNPDIVCLPELPPEYTWNAEDGDFNIFRKSTLRSWVRVHSRELNEQTYRLREFGEWQSEPFANLQDLVDVTAARFWIGDLP